MNIELMAWRCPTAHRIGTSEINGYKLVFRGWAGHAYATIEQDADSKVPVVLWEIETADELALDKYEGFPLLYHKENFKVKTNRNKTVTGMAYIMNGYELNLPSEDYFQTILDGYTDNGIDTEPLFAAMYDSKKGEDE